MLAWSPRRWWRVCSVWQARCHERRLRSPVSGSVSDSSRVSSRRRARDTARPSRLRTTLSRWPSSSSCGPSSVKESGRASGSMPQIVPKSVSSLVVDRDADVARDRQGARRAVGGVGRDPGDVRGDARSPVDPHLVAEGVLPGGPVADVQPEAVVGRDLEVDLPAVDHARHGPEPHRHLGLQVVEDQPGGVLEAGHRGERRRRRKGRALRGHVVSSNVSAEGPDHCRRNGLTAQAMRRKGQRSPPGTHRTSPFSRLAWRARMKSRSERRLR